MLFIKQKTDFVFASLFTKKLFLSFLLLKIPFLLESIEKLRKREFISVIVSVRPGLQLPFIFFFFTINSADRKSVRWDRRALSKNVPRKAYRNCLRGDFACELERDVADHVQASFRPPIITPGSWATCSRFLSLCRWIRILLSEKAW